MKPQQSTNVDMIAPNIYLIPLIMLIMPMPNALGGLKNLQHSNKTKHDYFSRSDALLFK